ncbi:YraN family protein [Microcella sp.]|uniref:YraN family protein n=1 Tax=Microcella sp. TaxID=1913979 RepID=UPI00299F53A3|nr:YraN family protein [Microcella sp.]MDX2025743.1 YraN family protein [Microcella sp.]
MARKDELGRKGEQLAVDHLTALGYVIIDRNWRCAIGEIDIVARHGSTAVVVEVKTRSGTGFGHPLDAVTPRKLARLRRLAGAWCDAHEGTGGALRIDVIGVVVKPAGVTIDHVKQVC